MVRMTHEAIFEAIQRAQETLATQQKQIPPGELEKGVTAQEYADEEGIGRTTANRILTDLVRSGDLVVEFAHRIDIIGRRMQRPVYRPAEDAAPE